MSASNLDTVEKVMSKVCAEDIRTDEAVEMLKEFYAEDSVGTMKSLRSMHRQLLTVKNHSYVFYEALVDFLVLHAKQEDRDNFLCRTALRATSPSPEARRSVLYLFAKTFERLMGTDIQIAYALPNLISLCSTDQKHWIHS